MQTKEEIDTIKKSLGELMYKIGNTLDCSGLKECEFEVFLDADRNDKYPNQIRLHIRSYRGWFDSFCIISIDEDCYKLGRRVNDEMIIERTFHSFDELIAYLERLIDIYRDNLYHIEKRFEITIYSVTEPNGKPIDNKIKKSAVHLPTNTKGTFEGDPKTVDILIKRFIRYIGVRFYVPQPIEYDSEMKRIALKDTI